MKKSLKAVVIAIAMLFTANVYAESDFDWSQCWCNYGAGIKEGDKILSVDGGIDFGFFNLVGNHYWSVPAVVADFEVAKKIWKLPFTFGGYAGFKAWGWKNDNASWSCSNIYAGGSATYHIMLPPEKLDVYGSLKTGFVIHTYSDGAVSGNPFNLDFATNIGASYYFSDNFGVNLEFGYPFQKFGLQFKF